MGGKGKNLKKWVTSFIDSPLVGFSIFFLGQMVLKVGQPAEEFFPNLLQSVNHDGCF